MIKSKRTLWHKILAVITCFMLLFSLVTPAVSALDINLAQTSATRSVTWAVNSINHYAPEEFYDNIVSVVHSKTAYEWYEAGRYPEGADYTYHTAFIIEYIGLQNSAQDGNEFIVESVISGEVAKDTYKAKTKEGFVLYILTSALNEGNSPKRGDLVDTTFWITDPSADDTYRYSNDGIGSLIFSENPSADREINTVKAADVNAKIKLFNYDENINNAISNNNFLFYNGSYGEGAAVESVDGYGAEYLTNESDDPYYQKLNLHKMSDTLDENGYPVIDTVLNPDGVTVVEENDVSLAPIFDGSSARNDGTTTLIDTMENGGGLFREAGGYYYYDSLLNAAYYDPNYNGEGEGQFVLYDNIVRPWYNTRNGINEPTPYGNFLPFNKVTPDNTTVDGDITFGGEVRDDLDYYHDSDNDYPAGTQKKSTNSSVTSVTSARLEEKTDMWFGLTVDLEFVQPKNGKLSNNDDMMFRFYGDDDVFVYLGVWDDEKQAYDYRLALDIGGIHGARTGSINFATGELIDFPSTSSTARTRTIADIFEGSEVNGAISSDTFEDYTKLSLKFFYLERGGNISYCGLGFNIPALPQNSLTVNKHLDTTVDVFEDVYPYQFRIVKADENGEATNEPLMTSGTYDIIENNVVVGTGKVDSNGYFTLKAGQYAQFSDMMSKTNNGKIKYIVQEIIKADVTGQYAGATCVVGGTNPVEVDYVALNDEDEIYSSSALSGEKTETVTYINKVEPPIAGTLKVSKKAMDGDDLPADKAYNIKVKLGGTALPVGTQYYLGSDSSTLYTVETPGIIPLKVGQTATLKKHILAGTTLEISEENAVGYVANYTGTITTDSVVTNVKTNAGGATGVMTVGGLAQINVINSTNTTGIHIDKYVEETDDPDKFELKLESYSQGNTVVLPKDDPMDIVLVLDQSASMYAPVGQANKINNNIIHDIPGAMTFDKLDPEKGKQLGYYVAQSSSGRPDGGTTYYDWFVLQYIDGAWYYVRCPDTSTPVNMNPSNLNSGMGGTLIPSHTNFNYYKSQYGALYDAVTEFVTDVKDTGINHKIGVVGFASPFYDGHENYNGSGIYVDGKYYLYDTDYVYYDQAVGKYYDGNEWYNYDRKVYLDSNPIAGVAGVEQIYNQALVDISTDEGFESVLKSVNAVKSNYWHTCPAAGLDMANNIFKETYNQGDTLNDAKPERERMIILFTDGYPTTATGANMLNRHTDDRELYWEDTDNYAGRKDAIAISNQSKHYYSADVYTVGTSLMNDEPFLEYVSSDYPNAKDLENLGSQIDDPTYSSIYTSAEDLSNIFSSIMQTTTKSEVSLGLDAYTKEVLTDYFELYGDAVDNYGIKAYTADYLGDGVFDEEKELETANITLESSKNDGRIDVIKVSGFDYTKDYIVEASDESEAKGKKLIIKVPVKTRDGFWGGNNVPTNKDDTAIYENNKEEPVISYPIPEVNVPRTPVVTTKDNVIYYGGEIDNSDVFESITIDGVDVIIGTDGSLTPSEPWMDDFTSIKWADNSSTNNTAIDNKNADDYTFSVVLTPDTDGSVNISNNPSNIVGSTMSTNGIAGVSTAKVDILIPVITYEDSTIKYGDVPDDDYYSSENYVSVVWVSESTGEEVKATNPDSEPTLDFTYTVAGTNADNESEYNHFKFDTKIDVTVSCNNVDGKTQDITNIVLFKSQCDEKLHTEEQDIADHSGSVNSAEFWVHVEVTNVAIDDTVVIDFGLPVDINVMANDLVVSKGNPKFKGITEVQGGNAGEALSGSYGKASVKDYDSAVIEYVPDGMNMSEPEMFYYTLQYTTPDRTADYNAKVTIIPATNIYYEDNFLKFSDSATKNDSFGAWISDGETTENAIQAQDRVGVNVGMPDADNVYGYDKAYDNCSTFSLGSATKVTVDSTTGAKIADAPKATFTFTGTGFDVVSLTNNRSGVLRARVYETDATGNKKGSAIRDYIVNNYYGYDYNEETGEWEVVSENGENALYQVPVMKVDLTKPDYEGDTPPGYGTYFVEISVIYNGFMDMTNEGSYTVWLDAVRIYNPAQNSDVANNAYKTDKEFNPIFGTVKSLLLDAESYLSGAEHDVTGVLYIDGIESNNLGAGDAQVGFYKEQGPTNEAYLKNGNGVAFKLVSTTEDKPVSVHIGAKLAKGSSAILKHNNINLQTITTATNMFYKLDDVEWTQTDGKWVSAPIVISCGASGDDILSLTDIKITTEEEAVVTLSIRENAKDVAQSASAPVVFAMYDDEVMTTAFNLDQLLTYGDVDLDGEITVLDATMIQKHIAALVDFENKATTQADVNFDNVVSITDATSVQMYLANLIDKLPVEQNR